MNAHPRIEPVGSDKPEGQPLTMTYTNWRGEMSERKITPIDVWFGSTEWHPEPQWILSAWDHVRAARRDFALVECVFTTPADLSPRS